MNKTIWFIFLLFISTLSFAQTKSETISYLNNILQLHQTQYISHSFTQLGNTFLIANKLVTIPGYGPKVLKYKFNPKDALYISTMTEENGRTRFSYSFIPNSLKLIYTDYGETKEEMTTLQMESLTHLTKTEVAKFIQAYKHLIKLYGGAIKDDLF